MRQSVEQALDPRRVRCSWSRRPDFASWPRRQRRSFGDPARAVNRVARSRRLNLWSRRALTSRTRRGGGGRARLSASTSPSSTAISRSRHGSPRLPVGTPPAAMRAVFGQLQTVGVVSPVLRRVVRVRLALAAAQRDEHAITLCHGQIPSSIAEWKHRVGGLPPSSHERPLPRYSRIDVTAPAPTVRPPSRIAKRSPSSSAIGEIRRTLICTLSPGIAISTPSGRPISPVTSVVRM